MAGFWCRCFIIVAFVAGLLSCKLGNEKVEASHKVSVHEDIDSKFPGPLTPSLEPKYVVKSIRDGNVLVLDSGQEIGLAGVSCGAQMLDYLQALFFGSEPDFLVYQPSGYTLNEVRFAYVWVITPWELGDPDLEVPASVSSLNETGVRSGWCKPVEQDFHSYHSRYMALSVVNMNRQLL